MPVTADDAHPANPLYFGPWDRHQLAGRATEGARPAGDATPTLDVVRFPVTRSRGRTSGETSP